MARVRRDNDARYALRASFVDENGEVISGDTITITTAVQGIGAADILAWNATTLTVATKEPNWDAAYSWGDHAAAGYLTSFTETDPTVPAHVKAISSADISEWGLAYSWGDHSAAGYLTSFTESDPTVPSHVKSITTTEKSDWNTAYGWGDHSVAGYLTSFTETDPTVPAHVKSISSTNISNWNTAYGWGDHAAVGYLTSFTESDPTVPAHVKSIASTDISNWDTAHGWGDHAAAGYGLAANDYWSPVTGGISYGGGTATVANVVLGGSGTIANGDWSKGTFHLGDATIGWAMDPNELYNSGDAIIGTLADNSTLTFNPKGSIVTSRPFVSTNTITASGGDSNQWNNAFSWGDHGAVDYFVNNSTVALSTTNSITALSGDGVGNIALTTNDGGGNSNLVFNEVGTSKQAAGYNSGRIHVNTDATSAAAMTFKLGSGAAGAEPRGYPGPFRSPDDRCSTALDARLWERSRTHAA